MGEEVTRCRVFLTRRRRGDSVGRNRIGATQRQGPYGALLTAALDAGATTVQGLSYGLRDDHELRTQALRAALADAGPRASAAAAAAGLTLGGIRSIEELPAGGRCEPSAGKPRGGVECQHEDRQG